MTPFKNVPQLTMHIPAVRLGGENGATFAPSCGLLGMAAVGESWEAPVGSVGCRGCRAHGYRNGHEPAVRVIRFAYVN